MLSDYWKKWWKAAGIRAIKTFAQAAISVIPVAVSIAEVEWLHVAGVATAAAVLSLLTSLAGLPEVETEVKTDDYYRE